VTVAALLTFFLYRKILKGWSTRGSFLGFPKELKGKLPKTPTEIGKIKSLCIYPIKSCKPVKVEEIRITKNGMQYDRIAMIITAKGTPVTQRMIPELATVEVIILEDTNQVRIISPVSLKTRWNYIDVDLEPPSNGRVTSIDLHGISTACVDLGNDKADWVDQMLSSLRNKKCTGYRIVSIAKDSSRRVHYSPARLLMTDTRSHDGTFLSDLAPLSLTSESSLQALNKEIGAQSDISMDRFRSNMVMHANPDISINLSFVEDWFEQIQVGTLKLRIMGPTFRCVIPSVDQNTGAAGFRRNVTEAEPLKTLKRVRSGGVRYGLTGFLPVRMGGSKGFAPLFGVYVGVDSENADAIVRVNDPIRVLSYR